jgi:hypothetical protein
MDEKWAREIVRWCRRVRRRGGAAKTCVGMTRKRRLPEAWSRCRRRAMSGEILCAAHRDALNGVVLGILQREQEAAERRARRRSCKPCAGHTRNRGGKTDAYATARTGPGVSVSCSHIEAAAVEAAAIESTEVSATTA